MSNLINEEDAQTFIDLNPTVEDVDRLSKAELKVLASHVKLSTSGSEVKSALIGLVKNELFGIYDSETLQDRDSRDGYNVGVIYPASNSVHVDNSSASEVPPSFTPEQQIEIARIEVAKTQAQIESQRIQADHDYRMAQLNSQISARSAVPSPPQGLTVSSVIPPFKEENAEDFFVMFEEVAKGMLWTKEQWSFMLQTVLIGKGRITYASVDTDVRQDYDLFKSAIFKAYQLRPEAYRQSFRNVHRKEKYLL